MLTILSLGAGVQSTTLALMAAHREILPTPDCAIFADTGEEPEAVYAHLNWLCGCDLEETSDGRTVAVPGTYQAGVLPFPVHVVAAWDGYYRGDVAPFPMRWGRSVATATIDQGFHSAAERKEYMAARARGERSENDMLERMGHRERAATPPEFADALIELARASRG